MLLLLVLLLVLFFEGKIIDIGVRRSDTVIGLKFVEQPTEMAWLVAKTAAMEGETTGAEKDAFDGDRSDEEFEEMSGGRYCGSTG